MKRNITTVIEITDSHIKFLQSKFIRGKRVVSACDLRLLSQHTDEEIIRSLNDIILDKHIYPEELVVVVPRRLVILKQMALPSQNEAEIKKMIGLQLINKIPYGVEDVVYHFEIIEKEVNGYARVMVTVIHKEVCERFLKIFSRVGVQPARLTLSSYGVLKWLVYQENLKKIEARSPVAVINIDTESTEICFCHNQKLLFSRSITFGARDLTPENFIPLIQQIESSLGTYQKENMGQEIKRLIFLSTLGEALGFSQRVEKELKISTEVFSSLENILSQKNINLSTIKEQAGVALAVDFGFLMTDPQELMNLMPQEVHDTRKTKLKRREWVQFILLLAATVFLFFSIFGIELYQKHVFLKNIENQLDGTKLKVKEANRVTEIVNVLRNKIDGRVLIAELMSSLFGLTPVEISFRSLHLDDQGNFDIQGYAQTSSSVNIFQKNLVRSSVLKDVNLQFATKRRIFNEDVTDFKIMAKLRSKKDQD